MRNLSRWFHRFSLSFSRGFWGWGCYWWWWWWWWWGLFVLFFSFIFRYIILLYTDLATTIDLWHTLYLFLIYIYDDVCCFSPLSMCCFFSLFIHIFLYVCNLLFLFHTKMSWWVLFKVFQKDRLSKSIMPWTLFLQSFSRVCLRIRFYCIQQVIMSWVIYTIPI